MLELTYPEMIEYGAAAVATAREPWVASFAWFARSLGPAVARRGAEALAELAGADAPGAPSGLDGLVARGMIRLWTDDLAGAYHDLTAVVERASRGEALRIGQPMAFLGETEYRRGALGESVLHTDVAVGDARENHRVWDYAMVHVLASYPLAAQARWGPAEAHAEQATRWARQVGTPAGLVYAAAGRAALAQARDDAGRLLAAAAELETVYPAREPGTHLVGPLRADALSRLGRTAEAHRALDAFTERLPSLERASTRLGIARVRAQIAAAAGDHREALRHCRHAAALAREVGLPLETARIDLLAGGYHGAVGQRAAAERALRAALRRFTELGATAYVDQTLRAADRAGLSMAGPPAALGALTPAERAVVTLACQGLSNREIAARLVLSVKTIEFHLTNAYRRLDVATRGVTGDGREPGGDRSRAGAPAGPDQRLRADRPLEHQAAQARAAGGQLAGHRGQHQARQGGLLRHLGGQHRRVLGPHLPGRPAHAHPALGVLRLPGPAAPGPGDRELLAEPRQLRQPARRDRHRPAAGRVPDPDRGAAPRLHRPRHQHHHGPHPGRLPLLAGHPRRRRVRGSGHPV